MRKSIDGSSRFFRRSKRTLLLVIVAVSITLFFSLLIALRFIDSQKENEQSLSNNGTIDIRGVEIYGGDIKSKDGKLYIDWGELHVGDSKNAWFYVQSARF